MSQTLHSSASSPTHAFVQSPIWHVLTRSIPDTARNRAMQEMLDRHIDARLPDWDVARGLYGARHVSLPHETVPGFWSLPIAQRKSLCSPEASNVYAANHGRAGTSHLFVAAFCHHCSFSRHHRKPELAQIVLNAMRHFADSVTDDGCLGAALTSGEPWSEGWDIEGIVYSCVWMNSVMPAELRERLRDRLSRCAARLATLPEKPSVIGSYGNQRLVYALGLELYGQFLGDALLREKARAVLADALPKVLDVSGQVIEQMGPCMHYSYTSFFYAWLNQVVSNSMTSGAADVLRTLRWFVDRHTRDLTPFAGPSTRKHYEVMPSVVIDLLPAAVQLASVESEITTWVVRAAKRAVEMEFPQHQPDEITQFRAGVTGHGGSPLVWAMLMSASESQVPHEVTRESRRAHGVSLYDSCSLLKRSPLRYLLVHRRYQTHYNFTDFLPFSGIQTWAWGDEPALIHPTPMCPSTTRAMGIDTARQGVSHNWGLFGAGAVGIDGYTVLPREQDDPAWLVARYDQIFRLVIFTPASTVQIEFGNVGPRTTRWTLNRQSPAEPIMQRSIVRFSGRESCLHTSAPRFPVLRHAAEADPWATGVRWLEYECGCEPVLFAFSGEPFELLAPVRINEAVRFRDASGRYTIQWDERFVQDNPGCLRVDTFALAHGTRVVREPA